MKQITTQAIEVACINLTILLNKHHPKARALYGIPRGGWPAAYALGTVANRKGLDLYVTDDPEKADVFVDDLADSGATRKRYRDQYGKPVVVLFTKLDEDADDSKNLYGQRATKGEWLVFPWEIDTIEGRPETSAEDIPTRLLQLIGEDPKRQGLVETPARFVKAWKEWTKGYGVDPSTVLKCFEDGANGYDEMVLVSNIPVVSKCEHHMADIFGLAHVAYIPDGKIVGLSKVARLVDVFARRLTVQERLTVQVADAMQAGLSPKGVGVVLQCRHACMESRGAHVRGTITTTSAMRGALLSKPEARAEFLRLIDGARNGVSI